MKKMLLLCVAGLLVCGCSKSEEQTKREKLGRELADRIKTPIEDARDVSEKVGNIRSVQKEMTK